MQSIDVERRSQLLSVKWNGTHVFHGGPLHARYKHEQRSLAKISRDTGRKMRKKGGELLSTRRSSQHTGHVRLLLGFYRRGRIYFVRCCKRVTSTRGFVILLRSGVNYSTLSVP